jgi:hypothetical protein
MQYIPEVFLIVILIVFIKAERNKKKKTSLDKINLHRAGIRIKKNYGAGAK